MPTIVLADANPAKIRKYQNRTRSRNPEFLAFEHYLRHERHATESTICQYLRGLSSYCQLTGSLNFTHARLLRFRDGLERRYAPKTVEAYLTAVNRYIAFRRLRVRPVACHATHGETYLENVITLQEYRYLLRRLKEDGDMRWYFIIRVLGATGVRAQELVLIQWAHMLEGHVDIRSKHRRLRRVYFPAALRQEAVEYLSTGAVAPDGYICAPVASRCDGKHRKGLLPTCSAAHIGRYMVKRLAVKYGMAREVMHPHSFRHMFAKAFVAKRKDIAMLADLLGHASISTTRIYLRQSAREQAALVDRLVTW